MAIIQISKIQQRSGNLVDLPQLDEAQFGWATDAKRLFIGKTSPNENIEVLTSYSNISFSQIDGSDGGNFNIANATNGQVLTYVDTTNTWENWPSADILTANANFKLDLGDVGNIKMTGGATGYVLETDGTGNLAWTSKGTLRVVINDLEVDAGNANILVMTVPNTTPYTNSTEITISGANATNANTIVNGLTFYTKVDANFAYNGIVTLYENANLFTPSDGAGLGTYTANSGLAITSLSSGATSNAEGSVNSIQFNDSGILNGSANFTLTGGNLVTLTGNLNASNIAGGNLVTANFVTATLTSNSAAQPNITSTGTLAGLVVAGNITPSTDIIYNLGNNTNRFNDLYLANSTIYIGSQTISANATNVIISGILTANISGNISGNATTAGTVTTNAQPNITSVGILTSLSVSGNITTGNLDGANNITANYFIGSGNNLSNIQGANVSGAVTYATTANSVAGANVSGAVSFATTANSVALANVSGAGNIASINLDGSTSNILYGNGIFAPAAATYGNSDVATFLANYGSNTITTTGNISVGNIIGNGQALSGIVGANVTGAVTYAGTANSVALANVSGAGNIASINLDGSTSNVLYGNGVFAPAAVSYGNSNVATFLASYGSNTITTTGNINAGNIITGGIVSATGNITAPFFIGNGSQLTGISVGAGSQIVNGNSNVTVSANSNVSISVTGTSNVMVITSTGSNITGTLSVSGNTGVGNLNTANAGFVGGNNVTFTTGSNTNPGTFTGNFSLSTGSRLNATYADLAEYYEADQHYEPGTVLQFGGDKEVTLAEDGTNKVAGVVSTDPAYVMNTKCEGEHVVALALQGRVPTKVRGTIRKGDMLVSGGDGYARPSSAPHMGTVIGKSLENFTGEGIIEVAVGRL